jgi:uncharacterized protein (DUF983 family)
MSPIEMTTTADATRDAPSAKDAAAPASEARPLFQALWRGVRLRCPACGRGRLFSGYLATHETCPECGEELHHHRADDAPPYLTILTTGHVVVPMIISTEVAYAPPVWVHMALWIPMVLGVSLFALPRFKGAIVGVQWALKMHGFDPDSDARHWH